MMVIYSKITLALDLKVEETVPREEFEHMVEKWNSGIDLRHSRTIQLQPDPYIGLLRSSGYSTFSFLRL
jgi:hypothetical protein